MISRPKFSAHNLSSLSTKPMISDHLGISHTTSKGTHQKRPEIFPKNCFSSYIPFLSKMTQCSYNCLSQILPLSLLTSPSALFNQSLSLKYPTSYRLTNLSLFFTLTTTAKPGFPALTVHSLN